MKVLHVIPAIAPRYGGPSYAVYRMCSYMRQQSIQPLIATTNADGEGVLPVSLGEVINYQDVPTIFFQRDFSEALKYSRRLAQWLNERVKEFDVVHIHAVFSHACLAAARACRQSGVPYIVRPLGTLDPWSLQQKSWRKTFFWRFGAGQMMKEAAAVHYTTNEEQRLAETGLHLQRGVVIPNGVDDELFQVTNTDNSNILKPQPSPYVLTLGRLHPKKQLELLIEAFITATNLSEWKLMIAGDGEPTYVEGLQRLANKLGGEERIVFPGWLAGEEKKQALRGASVFALISRQENFGIAAAEALACGVPVLLSEHVNLAAEVKEAGGGWIAALEKESVAASLIEALSDSAARRRRGEAARLLAEKNYRWPVVAERLANLYAQVLNDVHSLRKPTS